MAYNYRVEIRHEGLNKYKVVKGETAVEAELKAASQLAQWESHWAKHTAAEAKRTQKQVQSWDKEGKRRVAIEKTQQAERELAALETLLTDGIRVDSRINWSRLKDRSPFSTPEPQSPKYETIPREPQKADALYQPALGVLDKLFSSLRGKKEQQAMEMFLKAHSAWSDEKARLDKVNLDRKSGYDEGLRVWNIQKIAWLAERKKQHDSVDAQQRIYLEKQPSAIAAYCELVLTNSEYPPSFPEEFVAEYNPETRTLVADASLPAIVALPTVKEYKYVAARDQEVEVQVSDAWLNRTYDSVLYQIALRSLYELFQADAVSAIDSVVFNGWVRSIDKATGKEVNACILSIQANKAEFLEINLGQVDPKTCFKKLKGVSAAKLTALSPVVPILRMKTDDDRFITPYAVVDGLQSGDNLAAMDWEDFEHLIRELFEKEFSANGGEVKITQASRDGGVDAVVFDPDPIRGGKIVIQAKRYTNTVSVSAVRDLFGTVHNEGANKGILVTTADYGPDAYEFAKGKPLTLLSGNELLYLLQKHGHKARIDLAEARALAAR